MGAITVLQLAASHPDAVGAIVMVDPAPLQLSPAFREALEGLVAAIEAGNDDARRQFIENALFLPHSPIDLRERVTAEMLSAPGHVAAGAMRGIIEFDGPAAAAACRVPALHIAATPPLNPPHVLSELMPDVVHGWTVGAGHFNQLEAADQVNSMIEAFARHYVPAKL